MILRGIFIFILSILSVHQIKGWGFHAHKLINKTAVFSLPPELAAFYKRHIDHIESLAIQADQRRYVSETEAMCHYLDADHYGEEPSKIIPKDWFDAISIYGKDTLKTYGILPWHILETQKKLEKAFKEKNVKQIIHLSADLGHYMADASVPLHTTENYNGQLSNQHGIHALWESRLPELFSTEYNLYTGKVKYWNNPKHNIWETFFHSFAQKDSVLFLEQKITDRFPNDQKHHFEKRGNATQKVYSYEFSDAYHNSLDHMVERNMKIAIKSIASLWYTAWINAGSPKLDNLDYEKTKTTYLPQKMTKGRQHE